MAGIHAEIAEAKCKYWSTFAPNPVEVVLAAGEKAKQETGNTYYSGSFSSCSLSYIMYLFKLIWSD